MMKKILLALIISLAIFSSISFAESWVYPDSYGSGISSGESWVYPDASDQNSYYSSYYYSNSYPYYSGSYYSYYSSGYSYYSYNYYPYRYSSYYNTYYPSSGYYPNYYGYTYAQSYPDYTGFTYASDLQYGGYVNTYIDPIVSSQAATPSCRNPNGNEGERKTMGIGTKVEFECRNGAWIYVRTVPAESSAPQPTKTKAQFYNG